MTLPSGLHGRSESNARKRSAMAAFAAAAPSPGGAPPAPRASPSSRQQRHPCKLNSAWRRKTLAGHRLFLSYYSGQPGVVVAASAAAGVAAAAVDDDSDSDSHLDQLSEKCKSVPRHPQRIPLRSHGANLSAVAAPFVIPLARNLRSSSPCHFRTLAVATARDVSPPGRHAALASHSVVLDAWLAFPCSFPLTVARSYHQRSRSIAGRDDVVYTSEDSTQSQARASHFSKSLENSEDVRPARQR
jgi:hypothetical protein